MDEFAAILTSSPYKLNQAFKKIEKYKFQQQKTTEDRKAKRQAEATKKVIGKMKKQNLVVCTTG